MPYTFSSYLSCSDFAIKFMDTETITCAHSKEESSGHVRRAGIDPNRWYMIAKISDIGEKPLAREIWRQPVVLFRTQAGQLHALENRCAHRFVRLSHGRVIDDTIECAYHGWRFNTAGHCVHVPQLADRTSLPKSQVRSFPVIERNGFVWIFPGNPDLSATTAPTAMNEWDDLNEITSFVGFTARAHFSYVIENLMDMYHGSLHSQYQVWTAQALKEVVESENQVTATYQATTYYRLKNLSSILELFIPALRQLRAAPLTVTYDYPNWKAALGEDFKIFCLICPVNERCTEAYLLHYTSLAKFSLLKKTPLAVRRLLKRALGNVAKRLLVNLVRQDVVMIDEEQQAFDTEPFRQPTEINRTIRRVQQLIRRRSGGEHAGQGACANREATHRA